MPDPSSGVNAARWNGLAGAKSITLTKNVATSEVIAATYGRYARCRRLVSSCVMAPNRLRTAAQKSRLPSCPEYSADHR